MLHLLALFQKKNFVGPAWHIFMKLESKIKLSLRYTHLHVLKWLYFSNNGELVELKTFWHKNGHKIKNNNKN